MKINPNFEKNRIFFVFFIASFLFFGISFADDKPDDPWKNIREDGLPLNRSAEKETIRAILSQIGSKNLSPEIPGNTGFISLNKNSKGFRGKIVKIEGRLLKIQFLPSEQEPGLYISWILLDDEPGIPIRIISQKIPEGFKTDLPDQKTLGKERVQAIGFYYRLIPFTDGQNFYNTPTLIARDFSRAKVSSPSLLPEQIPKKDDSSQKAIVPQKEDFPLPVDSKDLSSGERKDLLRYLSRLHDRTGIAITGSPIRGWLKEIQRIPLTEEEKRGSQFSAFYRCLLVRDPDSNEKPFIFYTTRIPSFEINAEGRSFRADPLAQNSFDPSKGKGERTGGSVLRLDLSNGRPICVLSQLEWYPKDHLLGQLGMNVAAFDRVPVFPSSALKTIQKLSGSQFSDRIGQKKKRILEALRFTHKDTEMFYGLLSTLKKEPNSRLLTDKAIANVSVVDLFNRPEQNQGKNFFLRGHIRRALYVPITDKEQQKRWGLDHFYQIFLFTSDSQGYPLVISLPDLPKGMPIGSGKEYREEVTVAAIFCKTWAYEKGDTPEPDRSGELKEARESDWARVPFLIAKDLEWIPKQEKEHSLFPWNYFWLSFGSLMVLFFLCRVMKYFAYFSRKRRFQD
ncbi:MAG: hypothetical protein Q4G69_03000 [Planctomycetia bacterium]|nr:hypothetical protein [Planctomycetia bacterium]